MKGLYTIHLWVQEQQQLLVKNLIEDTQVVKFLRINVNGQKKDWQVCQMIINRIWQMPNSNTFSIKPIKELIEKYATGKIVDPFANSNKLATVTNDLDTQYDTDYHVDALDFLKIFDDNSVDTVLYDPPYSPRQVSECYKNLGQTVNMQTTQASYQSKQKEQIGRIVKKDGIVITCSWNSGGIGKKYGFEIQEILLVPHGGWHNDTIVVVEKKIKQRIT